MSGEKDVNDVNDVSSVSSEEKGFNWDELKNVAFGALRLKPSEFWELTLVEVQELIEAVTKEEVRFWEMEYEKTAWLASNLMNVSGNLKKPMDVDTLLGRKKKQQQNKTYNSAEERQKAFEDLQKKFQGGA